MFSSINYGDTLDKFCQGCYHIYGDFMKNNTLHYVLDTLVIISIIIDKSAYIINKIKSIIKGDDDGK